MTRYYYTDPLSAAWMAKHFGMKFISKDSYFKDALPASLASDKAPLYIHPDSLHLLDVQYGDLTLDDDPIDNGHRWLDVSASAYMRKNFNRIIQRNSILFMWPEKESGDD